MASTDFYDLSILLCLLIKQQTEDKDNCGYMCGLCVPVPVHESACVISLVVFCVLQVPHEWICACRFFVISCTLAMIKTFYHIWQWRWQTEQEGKKKWRKRRLLSCLNLHLGAGVGSDCKATARDVYSVKSVLWACVPVHSWNVATFCFACACITHAWKQIWRVSVEKSNHSVKTLYCLIVTYFHRVMHDFHINMLKSNALLTT